MIYVHYNIHLQLKVIIKEKEEQKFSDINPFDTDLNISNSTIVRLCSRIIKM